MEIYLYSKFIIVLYSNNKGVIWALFMTSYNFAALYCLRCSTKNDDLDATNLTSNGR